MSSEPGTLRCPSCGAPVADPESRACGFCSTALALTACPSCFAPMFQGAKHCSRCGAGAARLAVDRAPRNCPECRGGLDALAVGAVTLDECRACGGVWLDTPSFDRICREREQQAVVLQATLPSPKAPPAAGPQRYWPCPECGRLMNRQNFARVSGVVLDVCRGHGVWFNHGELTRIVEFIREGGLGRAREREKTELQEERERLRQQQLATARLDARFPSEGGRGGIDLRSFVDLLDDFFD